MSCLQTQLFEARQAQRSELATGGRTSSPCPPVAWSAEMPALSESFFLFNSHDNSIRRRSRERHRFIPIQYNICKQRLTKVKHDYNKTTLQRIIFIDSEQKIITIIIIISLLSKVSYLRQNHHYSTTPSTLGMQICFEILTVNHNNIYRAVVNIIRINHIIYFI